MTIDYQARFLNTARLYGAPTLDLFQRSHICLVGLGGVGSWAAETLARTGIGTLTLIDPDTIHPHNTNRQLHTHDGNFTHPKTTALATRLKLINPDLQLLLHAIPITPDHDTAALLSSNKPHALIDAIDTTSHKAHLVATCRDLAIPCVSSGGAAGKRDATQIRAGDLSEAWGDQLLRLLRRKLRRDYGYPSGEHHPFHVRCVFSPEPIPETTDPDAPGTTMHVTAAFGLIAAQQALQLLQQTPPTSSP